MEPEEIFKKAWAILVEHAGAVQHEYERDSFVRAFLETKHPATEWRFSGYLGFGGKFWRNDGRYYVSCYPEDRNKKRDATIEKVNKLLAELSFYHPRGR